MANTTTQVLSICLPGSLVEAVQHIADEHGLTVSEAVRRALLTHKGLDPRTRQYATLLCEIAKTRCVL